jgi:hypothetical protein
MSTGRTRKMFAITCGVAVPFLILAVPSVVYAGMIGISLLFLATMTVVFGWGYGAIAKILGFGLNENLRMLIKPAVSSLIMASLCLLLGGLLGYSFFSLVLQVAFGATVYIACMTTFTKNQFGREVKDLVNGMIERT